MAQQGITGTVSGTVSDASGKQSMNGATIALFDLNDSSAAPRYETAKIKGAFTIRNITEGRYRLLVSFEGYENQRKIFSVTKENPAIDLGNIVMTRKSTEPECKRYPYHLFQCHTGYKNKCAYPLCHANIYL
ncbi:MAG: hypothetical protein NVS3B8_07820 [Chitinophagaceae bacterium]